VSEALPSEFESSELSFVRRFDLRLCREGDLSSLSDFDLDFDRPCNGFCEPAESDPLSSSLRVLLDARESSEGLLRREVRPSSLEGTAVEASEKVGEGERERRRFECSRECRAMLC
jgi:hypothetical protein